MDIPQEIESKLRRYVLAQKTLEEAKRATSSADTDLRNATSELGKAIIPQDAKDEAFNVLIGDGILTAKRNVSGGMTDFEIKWRKEPNEQFMQEHFGTVF